MTDLTTLRGAIGAETLLPGDADYEALRARLLRGRRPRRDRAPHDPG